ncbi:histone deacetylase family protein [Candidatus Latescibacterota bacterium]
MTGVLYHDDYIGHDTGGNHPERPERATVIKEGLEQSDYSDKLVWDEPRLASKEEIALVHSQNYIEHVKATCEAGPKYLDSPDNPVSVNSYNAALRAAGAVMTGIDGVIEGKYANAFCPVRPPGHHCRYSTAMGFCLFNNVTIGARYLKNKYNIRKILIVDFDVHHGNGTEEMIAGNNDILFFSIHQHPLYPGTGFSSKVNSNSGGIFNYPVPPGTDESAYMEVFKGQLSDYVNMLEPEFILVSAGFDAHSDDSISNINLTSESYYNLTKQIVLFADNHCDRRIVSTLEGGYNLNALRESAVYHVKSLVEAGS